MSRLRFALKDSNARWTVSDMLIWTTFFAANVASIRLGHSFWLAIACVASSIFIAMRLRWRHGFHRASALVGSSLASLLLYAGEGVAGPLLLGWRPTATADLIALFIVSAILGIPLAVFGAAASFMLFVALDKRRSSSETALSS